MNQGVVQSSPVQQMVAAAASPTWWSTIRPPPPPHHHSFPNIAAASDTHLDHQLQDSWSQLLLGGLVGEAAGNFEARKMENWEQQFVNEMSTTSCGSVVDVKQESSCGGGYNYNNTSTPKPTIINSCNWSHHHHHHQMVSASSSSPNSSSSITTTTTFTNNPHLDHLSPRSSSECNSTSTGGAAKKARTQPSSAHSTFKVRKEKLGDRVTALHQLVSPFGKTDTASVLLEAIGYIKFLETQIEALSQPYLGTGSSSSTPTLTQQHHPPLTEYCEEGGPKQDLKSRGLCLVPISCTLHVGSDNGADYWAPAFTTAANFR